MRSGWGVAAGFAVLTCSLLPGRPCGPFFLQTIFVTHQPESRAAVMTGHMGIIWPGFVHADMALAYRRLTGPAFTPAELASVQAQHDRIAAELKRNETAQPSPSPGYEAWIAATAAVSSSGGPIATDAKVPGQQWDTYPNCLDDAFANAARTLKAREQQHAGDAPDLQDWVAGQTAVFSNCGQADAMPQGEPVTKPLWLRQDRAYQTAAAHFYRSEWEPARTGFQAIAADGSSPWHSLAPYLVGRTWLREATLSTPPDKPADEAKMRAAAKQFQSVAKSTGPYAASARQLLNFTAIRLDARSAAQQLGATLAKPDAQLGDDLTSFAYALDHLYLDPKSAPAATSDLTEWVIAMTFHPKEVDDLARWRTTHSLPWLVAALSNAQNTAPADLLAAAEAVPRSSPAWETVTYHRLRLMPDRVAAETELTRLLPRLQGSAPVSTLNAFREVAQRKAPTLREFMDYATFAPAGFDDDGPIALSDAVATPKSPTMAGIPVNTATDVRFNETAAEVLNRDLPLVTLAGIARANTLPKQLHFELAMAVWTRAVLLGRVDTARSLTPEMVAGEPGWRPWLAAYDEADTGDDRQLAALEALMRFPSVRAWVQAGAGREEGFVGYSSYRDNWWCGAMVFVPEAETTPRVVKPAFVTPAMRAQTEHEEEALLEIGDAPAYFGRETLRWARAHPHDTRNAQLLGLAFRAMRNGCNLEASTGARREIFDLLQRDYANSEWAKRYPGFDSQTE